MGATLGDAEDEATDARSWIKKAKKKEKELAAKRAKELEESGKATVDTYDERTYRLGFVRVRGGGC